MLRPIAMLCLLLLTVPTVAAADADGQDAIVCSVTQAVIDGIQCLLNIAIDFAEETLQQTIRTACTIVFGEPC